MNNRAILEAALIGFAEQIKAIEANMDQVRFMLVQDSTPDTTKVVRRIPAVAIPEAVVTPGKVKRVISAAGRKAISKATKARWAAYHATKAQAGKAQKKATSTAAPKAAPVKRPLSKAQLTAMKKNAQKARAARAAKLTLVA